MELTFSSRLKDAIAHSREIAVKLKSGEIAVEHLFAGILLSGEGSALRTLHIHDPKIQKDTLLKEVEDLIIQNTNRGVVRPPEAPISLSKEGEKVLKVSYLEAKASKRNRVGTIDVFLSILRDDDLLLSKLLLGKGIEYDNIRKTYENLQERETLYEEIISGQRLEPAKIDFSSLFADRSKPLSLFFDTSEFSKEEIAMIISFLSDLYASIGGDELEIVGSNLLEFNRIEESVF